jgi:hypothetical protein
VKITQLAVVTCAVATVAILAAPSPAAAQAAAGGEKLVPIPFVLPQPVFEGTPQNLKVPNLEKARYKARDPFLAPANVKNVARRKVVTSSDSAPILGELPMINDGERSGEEGYFVELAPGRQWVQIDLAAPQEIYAILFWHFHKTPRVYFDIIVQVADDAGFTKNVRTVFNNDHDNTSKLGAGKDMNYVETSEGKLVDAKGSVARYVRLYSNGNNANELNHYVEVEVWGRPTK